MIEIGKSTQFSKENQPENPGRKKKLPEIDDLLSELLGNYSGDVEGSEAKEVFNALVKQAKKGNVPAAVAILNRAYGMPSQSIDHTTKGDKINPLLLLSDEDQEKIQLAILQNSK